MTDRGLVPCVAVPHHITAFFTPYTDPQDPMERGSTGVGLVVGPLARVCYSTGPQPTGGPLRRVLEELDALAGVAVHEPLPAQRGYATSAAVTLAGALAAAAARGFNLLKAAKAAHVAEIVESTGLGDVAAIYGGGPGVAVRVKPGAPGVGVVDYIPAPPGLVVVTGSRGSEHTRSLLARYGRREAQASRKALGKVLESMSFEGFVEAVRYYTRETRALEEVGFDSRGLEGVVVAYAKKRVVVLVVESDRVQDAVHALSSAGFEVRVHEIWHGGTPRVEWINPLQAPPW